MLTNILANSATLLDEAKNVVNRLLKEIDAEAVALQVHYYAKKDVLYQEELHKLEQTLGDASKALKRSYAPLNFSARVDDGRLEMSWWTRHRRPKGEQVLRHRVPWGTAKDHHGYYLPFLLKEAKTWEVDLVKEVEAHAVTLRDARAALLELVIKIGAYRRLLDRSTARMKCHGGRVPETSPAPSANCCSELPIMFGG